jgi:hypothetical protein
MPDRYDLVLERSLGVERALFRRATDGNLAIHVSIVRYRSASRNAVRWGCILLEERRTLRHIFITHTKMHTRISIEPRGVQAHRALFANRSARVVRIDPTLHIERTGTGRFSGKLRSGSVIHRKPM